jgi:hypothetical protein
VSSGACQACHMRRQLEVRQVRMYSKRKQWQWRCRWCRECWISWSEIMDCNSESRMDDFWSAVGLESQDANI